MTTAGGRVLAAALLIVSPAVAACGSSDERTEPSAGGARSTAGAPELEVPDGMRLVGLRQVVVAVPESWGTAETRCLKPIADTVFEDTGGVTRCAYDEPTAEELSGVSSLAVVRLGTGYGKRLLAQMHPSDPMDGAEVLESDWGCLDKLPAICSQSFAVPSEGVAFVVRVEQGSSEKTLRAIRRSLQVLPEGYTTVPFIAYGTSMTLAQRRLADAGLVGAAPDVDFPHYFTGTVPVAGSVVPAGGTVEMTIGDG